MSSCILPNSDDYRHLKEVTGLGIQELNALIQEFKNSKLDDPDAFPTPADIYNLLNKRFTTSESQAISVYNSLEKKQKNKDGYITFTEYQYNKHIQEYQKWFHGNIEERKISDNGKIYYKLKFKKPILVGSTKSIDERIKEIDKTIKVLEENLPQWEEDISTMSITNANDYIERVLINAIGNRVIPKSLYHAYRDKNGYTKLRKKELFSSIQEEKRVLEHNWGLLKTEESDGKLFQSRKVSAETLNEHLQNLSEKFGVPVVFLKDEEYKKRFKDGSSAQYKDGVAYFNSDATLTKNIGVEEILHPYIYLLAWQQPQLFEKLYFEAKKKLPTWVKEIEDKYKDNVEEEIVTQILAKYLNKEIAITKENKSLLQSIWEILNDILDFFSWHRTMEKRYSKKYFNNETLGIEQEGDFYRITASYAYDGINSFEDLAKLLNSRDVKVDVYTGWLQRAHLSKSESVSEQKKNTPTKTIAFDKESNTITITDQDTTVKNVKRELTTRIISGEFDSDLSVYLNVNEISDNKILLYRTIKNMSNNSDLLSIDSYKTIQISQEDFEQLSDESKKWLTNQPRQNAPNGDLIVDVPSMVLIYDHKTSRGLSKAVDNTITEKNNKTTITATEITELGDEFVKEILNRINKLRSTVEKYKDKSDVEILNDYGIEKMMKELRNSLNVGINDYLKNSDYTAQDKACELYTTSSWVVFRYIICKNLEKYGIKISVSGFEQNDTQMQTDKINEELEQDTDNVTETEGDTREHWQKNAKLLSIHDTVLHAVKREIGFLNDLDKDGNVKRNMVGFEKKVNSDEALIQIMNFCNGCQSLKEMVDVLTEKAKYYPYLIPLVEKLSVKDGETISFRKATFQAQFFTSMYKYRNWYKIQHLTYNGRLRNLSVEQSVTIDGIIQRAISYAKYNRIESIQPYRQVYKTTDSKRVYLSERAVAAHIFEQIGILDYINLDAIPDEETTVEGDKTYRKNQDGTKTKLYLYDRYKGSDFVNRLLRLVNTLNFNGIKNYTKKRALKNILTYYDDMFNDKRLPISKSGTKTYSSFSDNSELSKLATMLSNKDEKAVENWIKETYGDNYSNPWLRDELNLVSGEKLITILNSNNIEYEDKTDSQYLLSSLCAFSDVYDVGFKSDRTDDKRAVAWYPVPLQGDKTSEDYILGIRYDNNYIYKHLAERVLMQEIARMRAIRERWKKLKGVKFSPKEKIKNGKRVGHPIENEDALIKSFDKENPTEFAYLDILNDDFLDYIQEEVDANFDMTYIFDEEDIPLNRITDALILGHFSENDPFNCNLNHYGSESLDEESELKRLNKAEEKARIRLKGGEDVDERSKETITIKSFKELIKKFKKQKEKLLNTDYTNEGLLEKDKAELIKLAKPLIQIGIQIQTLELVKKMERIGMFKYEKTTIGFVNEKGEVEETTYSALKSIKQIVFDDGDIKEKDIKDFLLSYMANYKYASINIQMLTITDPSFFKNTVDMQKRLGYQLHGAGRHLNAEAIDPATGERVSDGKYRTVVIKDFITPANSYFAVEHIFNEIEKSIDKSDKETIAGFERLKKAYEEVNWTDGQSYVCPTSYRKIMLMGGGEWTEHDEYVYNHLDNLSVSDVLRGWQPLKPLVSAGEMRDMHNTVLPKMRVPVQFKNSAYVLMSIGLLANATGVSNQLNALMNFMEETASNNKGAGIDVIQFDSAVKVGLSGIVDVNNMSGEDTIAKLKERCILNDTKEYNPTYVRTVGFDTFMIQQDNPEHFSDHEQAMGSQVTVLAVSDLPNDATVIVDGKEMNGEDVKTEYWNLLAEIVGDAYESVIKEFHLNTQNKYMRNLALSEFLQREAITIEDIFNASLGYDNETYNITKDFNIPLSDPTQHKVISRVYSIIKKALFKKMIPGGPVVQVTNFGTNKNLQIVFKDANGNELKSAEELYDELKFGHGYKWTYQEVMDKGIAYYKTHKGKDIKEENKTDIVKAFDTLKAEYQKIIKNATGISHFECYCTPYSERLYNSTFYDEETGTFDIDAMNEHNPKLLEMLGYRIPTESKYSIMPLKIVGFLPKSAGEGIMLPQEITLLSGSDFDIDKMYCMRNNFDHEFGINNLNNKQKKINRLMELMRGSLTARQSFAEMFTPGGFETLKQLSKEFNEQQTTKDPYVSNLSNPLEQIKYFSKNMIAAKMIGIFANNVTSSAFVRLCATRNIHVRGNLGFNIDGKEILYTTEIDPVYDMNGRKVALNLAEGLAASTDATKEDALSYLNITEETVNVMTSLLRLGFPLRTATLVIINPAIKEAVEEYHVHKFKSRNPVSFNTFMRRRIAKLKNIPEDAFDTDNVDTDENENETKKSTVLTISSKELESYAKNGYMNEAKQQDADLLRDEIVALDLFYKVLQLSKVFRAIQSRTGYNSITHAFGPRMADVLKTQSLDDEFEALAFDRERDIVIDENGKEKNVLHNKYVCIEEALSNYLRNHPYLNNVKEASYNLSDALVGENFIQASQAFKDFYNLMKSRFEYLDINDVRKMETFFISYILLTDRTTENGEVITKSVFDLSDIPTRTLIEETESGNVTGWDKYGNLNRSKEKVSYKEYITSDSFPNDIDMLKQRAEEDKSHPLHNNQFLQNLEFIQGDENQKSRLKLVVDGLTPQQKQVISADWFNLYQYFENQTRLTDRYPSSEGNPAIDLVAYCALQYSFGFHPKGFLQAMPVLLKKQLNSYVKTLTMRPNFTTEDLEQMMYQFMLNNDIVDGEYDSDMQNYKTVKKPKNTPNKQIIYCSRDGGYYLVEYENDNYKRHKRIPKLGGNSNNFEVYPNLNIDEIKRSIFDGVDAGEWIEATDAKTPAEKINEFAENLSPEEIEDNEKRLNAWAVKTVFSDTNAKTLGRKLLGLDLDKIKPAFDIDTMPENTDVKTREMRKWAYQRLIHNWIYQKGTNKEDDEEIIIDVKKLDSEEIFKELDKFCQ